MKTSRTQNYIHGLTSGYIVTFATIFVGLWLTPFTLRYLDREQFAVFTLAGDVLMWLGLLEIGITSVLNVKAAQLSGKPDQNQLNQLASTTFFAQCAVALTFLLVGSFVSLFFPDFFSLRLDLRHDAMLVMALMVIGAALSVATQTFSALLVAHQQIHIDNRIRLYLIGIRTLLTVVLLIGGYGLISLAISHLAAVLVTGTMAVIRVRRLLPSLALRWRHFSWDTLRQTGGTGIWFSLGGLAGIMIMNLDRIVTAKIISVDMVTTLALTGRLYLLAWGLIQQVTNTARPALAQIVGTGDMEHAKAKFHQLSLLSTGLAIIAAASIWSGNGAFVTWWVGPQNYGGSALDTLLAVNLIIHSWVLPNRAILVAGLAYVPQNAISRFVEGGVNIALSIAFGLIWGIKGIILGTSVAGLCTTCWYFPLLTARYFNVSPLIILKKNIKVLGGVMLLLIASALFGRSMSEKLHGLIGAFCGSGFCIAIGIVFFWWYLLDIPSKEKLTLKLKNKFAVGRA